MSKELRKAAKEGRYVRFVAYDGSPFTKIRSVMIDGDMINVAHGARGNIVATYPIANAKAEVVQENERSRITATRLAAVGVFALAAPKRTGGHVFLSVEGDGYTLIFEADRREYGDFVRFAQQLNNVAKSH